jgi:hypothetical protein
MNATKIITFTDTPYIFDRPYYFDAVILAPNRHGRLVVKERLKLHRSANIREELIQHFGVNIKIVKAGE